MDNREPIIALTDVTKTYGEQTAVDRLNLTVYQGEIFGLLGPNGAGKSTTILMLLGLSEPDSGQVRVCGLDSVRQPLQVKRKVGYLPDDVGFYEDRTGMENLLYTARLNRIPESEAADRAGRLLERVGLADAGSKKVGAYSRGMRQRLGLADVLIKNPEVMILDEPTLGLDPEGMKQLLDLIRTLSREQNITVLLSSHHLHQVQSICDRVGLFVKGKLIADGTVRDLSMQLFGDEAEWIEASADPLDEPLLEAIRSVPGVRGATLSGNTLHIEAPKDAASGIASAVVQSGASLHSLHPKEYGLDEIYLRYFEGRDSNADRSPSVSSDGA
ncbi:ABC transporter ATP-binding protein [Paenibacillus alkalitolerans]|uniref:ABC transporter ATP-binding protein n=1 Tax=Paenibacillus alkalitolerans TaxID=2799335 RepID=UPI0018F79345|nr:ABC transporter ATP-binding protein [Paenibacillus alkalitolerans]